MRRRPPPRTRRTRAAGPSGADAAGDSDRPSEDAPFVPPPGWVDPGDLGRGVGGSVVGSKGGGSVAPSSDDPVINYGSEGGPITSERGPLANLTAVNMVGQPVPDTDAAPLDPVKLEELSLRDDDEVINPGGGEQAVASTQASTAYRAPEGAQSFEPVRRPRRQLPFQRVHGPRQWHARVLDADEAIGGAGDVHGREFGREQGQGHEHGHQNEEEV